MNIEDAIKVYHLLGLSNREILNYLSVLDDFIISERTLKRILRKQQLFRRKCYSDVLDVAIFLMKEIENSGQLLGYKFMHLKCIQNGFVVTQETDRCLLHVIDPEGVILRRKGRLKRRVYYNPGPNFMWHVDSYDKLKPYGICINGCIDGFSRFVIWLEAYRTNSDPSVIAGYFMNAVENRKVVPMRIRADRGTENGYVEQMQIFVSASDTDEYASAPFLYGSSNHNQRIESWWGQLRTHSAEFWITLFHSMKEEGKYVGDHLDKSLLQFCFMQVIQDDLDEAVNLWNSHRIRKSSKHSGPSGRPLTMYTLPQLYASENFLCPVSNNKIQVCLDECSQNDQFACDRDIHELCTILIQEKGMLSPEDAESAVELYETLRDFIFESL